MRRRVAAVANLVRGVSWIGDAQTSHAYETAYRKSLEDATAFWGEAATSVRWVQPPQTVLDSSSKPFYRWFSDGTLNTCYNAVDVHVEEGRGDKAAIVYECAYNGRSLTLTYTELLDQIKRFSRVLLDQGVEKGDRVVLYMPMIPEAVIAMLACARVGAVHSVVFGGFAPRELANRINDAQPKCIVSASCGFLGQDRTLAYKPMLDEAIELSDSKPTSCIIYQRDPVVADLVPGRDVDFAQATQRAAPDVPCSTMQATDPLYVLYTSGTTGNPKGIVRDTGGHAVALKWSMEHVYGVTPDTVMFTASDIGWVVGHSYIVYGPLFAGLTTVLFDGKPIGTPDASVFWDMIARHKVNLMFTAPTAFRAIRKEDPEGEATWGHDISTLHSVFLAGERSDPDTVEWLQTILRRRQDRPNHPFVFDHYWQTETGWPIVSPCVGLLGGPDEPEVKLGSCFKPVPGYDLQLLDDQNRVVEAPDTSGEETYNLALRLPLPPGTFPTLYNNPDRFLEAYITDDHEFYRCGDAGFLDEDGYVHVMTRTDDIINVAGHRFATSAIEEIVAHHPSVAECAVFGIADELRGQVPMGCVVLTDDVSDDHRDNIPGEIVELVNTKLGKIACFTQCFCVPKLPKTRSGKILRKEMSKIAMALPYNIPPTIEDPAVLGTLEAILR